MEPNCHYPHVWNWGGTGVRDKFATDQVPALSINPAKISALLAVDCGSTVGTVGTVDVDADTDADADADADAHAVSVLPAYQDLAADDGQALPLIFPDRFLSPAQTPITILSLASVLSGLPSPLPIPLGEVQTNRPSQPFPHHHHHPQPCPRPYMSDCIALDHIHTLPTQKSHHSSVLHAQRITEFVATSFSAPSAGGGRTGWSCRTSSIKRGRFESAANVDVLASDARHLTEADIISSLTTEYDATPPPSYQEAVDMSFWGGLGKKWEEVAKSAKEGLSKVQKEFEQPPTTQPSQPSRRPPPSNQPSRPSDLPSSGRNVGSLRNVFENNLGSPAVADPYAPPRPTPSDPYPKQSPYGGYSGSTTYRDPVPIPEPTSPSKQYNYLNDPSYTSSSYGSAPPPPYSPLPATTTTSSSIRRNPEDALIEFLNNERNPLTQLGIRIDPKNDNMSEPMDAPKKSKKGKGGASGNAGKKKESNGEPPTPIEPPTPSDDKSGGAGSGSGNGGDDKKDDDKDKGNKKCDDKKDNKKDEKKEEEEEKKEDKKEEEPETVPPTPSESVPPTPSVEKGDGFEAVPGKTSKKKKRNRGKDDIVPQTPAEDKPEPSTMSPADTSATDAESKDREAPTLEIDTEVTEGKPVEEVSKDADAGSEAPEVTVTDVNDIVSPTTAQMIEDATGEFQALVAENNTLKTQIHDVASEAGRSLSRLENRVSELGDEKSELQGRIQSLEVEVEESRQMQETMNQLQIERGRLQQLTEEQDSQIKEVLELLEKLKSEKSKFDEADSGKVAAAEAEAAKLRQDLTKATADFEELLSEKNKISEEKTGFQETAKTLRIEVRDLKREVSKTTDALAEKEKELLVAKAAKSVGNVRTRVKNLEEQLEQRLLDELAAKEERERLNVRVFELQKKVDEGPSEEEFNELRETITERDAEIAGLKNELSEAKIKILELEATIIEQRTALRDVDQLNDDILLKDAEIELQATEITELKAKVEKLEADTTEVDELKAAAAEQEELIKTVQELHEDAKNELEDLRMLYEDAEDKLREMDELKIQLEEAEKSASSSRELLATLGSDKGSIQGKLTELEVEKLQMESRLSALEAEKTEIEGKATALETEKAEIENKVSTLETEKAEIEGKFSALETEKAEIEDRFSALEAEKSELREKVQSVEDEKSSLEEQVATLIEGNTALDEKISALEEENIALSDSLQTTKDVEVAALNDKVAELTSVRDAHETDLTATREEKDGLVVSFAALKIEKDELEAALQASRDALATLETQLSAQSQGTTVFVTEINSLKDSLTTTKADLAAVKEELEASRGVHDEAKSGLENANADLAAANDKLAGLESEIGAKIAEITGLTGNVATLINDIEAKGAELDEARARADHLEAELASKTKELEEIGDKTFNERLEEEIAKSTGLAAEIEVLKANEPASREAPEVLAEVGALRDQLNDANTKVEALEAELSGLRDVPEQAEGQADCREHANQIYDLTHRIEDDRIRLDVTRDELTRTQDELAAYQGRFDDVEKQKIAAQTRAAETLEESVALRASLEEMERRALEAESRITVLLSGKGDYQRPRQTPTPPAETVDFEEKLRGSRQAFDAQATADADDPGFLPIPDVTAAATTEASRRERRRRHRTEEERREKDKDRHGRTDDEREDRRRRKEERKERKALGREVPDIAVSREMAAATEDESRDREREKRRHRRTEEREKGEKEEKERYRRARGLSGSEPRSPEVAPPADEDEERRKRRDKTRKSLLTAAAAVTAATAIQSMGSGSRREAPVKEERESSHRDREHREHRHRSHHRSTRGEERRSRTIADTPTLSQGVTSDDAPSSPIDEFNTDPNSLDPRRPDGRSLRTQSQRHSRLMIGGYEYESPRIANVTTYVVSENKSGASESGDEGYQDRDAKGWGKVRGLLKRNQTIV
ncbi:hypothetical protein TWF594_006795 [Orbilia oligospora]|uniref:Uncharacterized protein n=1 Tax=Orbilia oligospora TaxID=2813651 RepID=A0A7C8P8A9_ORBOL|nr:hypothetical protein TWF703_006016 [Orbilia oligospora]KAF3139040.1 hypothetical protein TWF594_006795 [Orbilia oligospora]